MVDIDRLFTHTIKKIKYNYKRFISLLCMAFLGVGFYSGVKITAPEITKSVDNYYDKQKVYDIKVSSPLGFTNKDIKTLEETDIINNVYGIKEIDSYAGINDREVIVKLIEFDKNINVPLLLEGNYPENDDEIIVEKKMLQEHKLSIGDSIFIRKLDKNKKIVGTFISPLYITDTRDATNFGNGRVDYNIYLNKNNFSDSKYSDLYVIVRGSVKLTTNTKDYIKTVDNVKTYINNIKGTVDPVTSKWVVYDRRNNEGYSAAMHAGDSISNIGNVFPLIFYLIAILIGLVSMTRMVDEDRVENGTLKALGFSSKQITNKYVIFASVATIVGGLLGAFVLNRIIPPIIFNTYQELLFDLPNFTETFDLKILLVGLLLGLVAIVGSSVIVSRKNLMEKTASMMRPKAPKPGKKILLERIPFIWKRLKFSTKIMIRNIFIFKGKCIATILGIAGCTALVLTGFGLKDSVSAIAGSQYGKIFMYDKMITLQKYDDDLIADLKANSKVSNLSIIYMNTVSIIKDDIAEIGNLIVQCDETFYDNIKLYDINDGYKEIKLTDDKVVITKKQAEIYNINVNDKIIIKHNNKERKVEVSNIVENYISQYVYMNKATYEKLFTKYDPNTLLLSTNMTHDESRKFDSDITARQVVYSINNSSDSIDYFDNMISSFNAIVIVFIIGALALALVVLYNLSTINIGERKREIATLKVLGFYPKEVDHYIIGENIILTIIGIVLGLFFGRYLCYYLVHTCETNNLIFPININYVSYFMAALITTLFAVLVSIITHFNLNKINMIESLQNYEE